MCIIFCLSAIRVCAAAAAAAAAVVVVSMCLPLPLAVSACALVSLSMCLICPSLCVHVCEERLDNGWKYYLFIVMCFIDFMISLNLQAIIMMVG